MTKRSLNATAIARALAAHKTGSHETAEKFYRKHLQTAPRDPAALLSYGMLKAQLKQLTAAEELITRAAQLKPSDASIPFHLGCVQAMQAKFPAAIESFRRSAMVDPRNARVHAALGDALFWEGKLTSASTAYETALGLDTDLWQAALNLGRCHQAVGNDTDAVKSFTKAISLRPDCFEAHYYLGTVLQRTGKTEPAIEAFTSARAIQPHSARALGALALAKRQGVDWSDHDKTIQELLEAVARNVSLETPVAPFTLAAVSDDTELLLKCCREFAASTTRGTLRHADFKRHDRQILNLAYVSGDYREHATSHLIADLIETHDRSKFKVFGVSIGPNDQSLMRKRMEEAFDVFIDVQTMTDDAIARWMRDQDIDIAVDLAGFAQHARMRIFALGAAPIQVGYLGWPGTSGADFMDYLIADQTVIPQDAVEYYSERVVSLACSYQPNDRKRLRPSDRPTRQSCGLPDGAFVFCCFNNVYKISPELFDVWCRLLRAKDGSVLWLTDDSEKTASNIGREAIARGIDPGRVIVSKRVPNAEHLVRHAHADIFLDTLPYNAHTTASDALFMGVPVITCKGRSFHARVAASLLSSVGLEELVTENLQDYEDVCLRLADSESALAAVRAKLAQNLTAGLLNTPRLAGQLEDAYGNMWSSWMSGASPELF